MGRRAMIGVTFALGAAVSACVMVVNPEPKDAVVSGDCARPNDLNLVALLAGDDESLDRSELDAAYVKLAEMTPDCVEHWQRVLREDAEPSAP